MSGRIYPVVHLIFACDEAEFDLGREGWVLANPWYAVTLPPGATFPFLTEKFSVYTQLADGLGAFELAVEIRHLVDEQPARVVGWSRVMRLEYPKHDRLLAIDTAFEFREVPFREPGIYEIRVLADGETADSWIPLTGERFELRVLDGRSVL